MIFLRISATWLLMRPYNIIHPKVIIHAATHRNAIDGMKAVTITTQLHSNTLKEEISGSNNARI